MPEEVISKKTIGVLKANDENSRILINIKMSWIRNTGLCTAYLHKSLGTDCNLFPSVCMPEEAGRPSAARRRGGLKQQASPRAGEAVGRRHTAAGRQNRRELGRRRADKGGWGERLSGEQHGGLHAVGRASAATVGQLINGRGGRGGGEALNIYQCCGSGMFIPDPGSWFLPTPDPGSKNSNRREEGKKICCHTFLCSHKFHKIENYFSIEVLKKKNLGQFSKNYRTFYPKNCH